MSTVPMMVMAYLMSLAEVAKALGVSVYTIRRLVASGSLPAVRIGARVMVSSATVVRAQREGIGSQESRKGH